MIQQTGNCIGLSAKALFGKMEGSECGVGGGRGSRRNFREEEGSRLKEEREAPRKLAKLFESGWSMAVKSPQV